MNALLLINQTSKDQHTRVVTLNPSLIVMLSETKHLSLSLRINSVKDLSERFFAALRMTWLGSRIVKCTNVMRSDLARQWVSSFHSPYLCLASLSRFSLSSLCLYLVFCLSSSAFAGHGFSSAFTNIEWLPEPGRTPDSVLYRLDAVQEEGKLLLVQTDEEKVRLCLTFAREKLAELEAMVKAEKADAAKTAAERYRRYADRAQQLTVENTNDKGSLADIMANAFLEHQYILSVIYEELPVSTRAVALEVIAAAQEKYQAVVKLLSPKQKGALFFKEEEVRWSVQMATRAEESSQEVGASSQE
jgi:hypothetical protein